MGIRYIQLKIARYRIECLASLNAKQGKREQSARLWGAGERFREDIGSPLPPASQEDHDRIVAAARQIVGDAAFSAGGR